MPSYRLLIGVPGKSNAFAISGKLGLSPEIIEDAKERVSSDAQNFEDVLSDLEASRIKLEQEHKTISENRKEISLLKKELREKTEKLEQSREKILQNANQDFVPDGQIIVDVAKGIEKDTLFTMTEILADELGKEGGPKGVRLVALSGPTHAELAVLFNCSSLSF